MPVELLTDRLRLGPWLDSDLDPYLSMLRERDPRAASAPRDGGPTRAQAAEAVRARQRELSDTRVTLYAIRADGAFAGYCGLTPGRASIDEPEIAFELLREFHGRGFASEAAAAVVAASCRTGRTRLWATVRTWNDASFRVLRRVGFVATSRTTVDEFGELAWWTKALQ